MTACSIYFFRNSGENITRTKHNDVKKLKKVRKIDISEFANFKSTHIWKLVNRLHHTKTRNRKGYETHVITLYSVVAWVFFCKFCLIFREFKADLIVTWLKCVAFLGYPSLARKMGKWEKQACFSKELALYKMQFVYYNLSSEKVGTRIIILNAEIIKKIHK